jgi:hypothetical protein
LSRAKQEAFWIGHSKAKTQTHDDDDLAPVSRLEIQTSSDEQSSADSQTVESPPGVILMEWHTEEEEKLYFQDLYSILDTALAAWENRVKSEGIDKVNAFTEYAFLNLPHRHDRSVIFGIRPDGTGFWRGYVMLYNWLVKIDISPENVIFGIEFGGIYGFETMGVALLFMGTDRLLYYTDSEGDFDEDEDGFYVFPVHGPYELRSLQSRNILDPFPPLNHPLEDMVSD